MVADSVAFFVRRAGGCSSTPSTSSTVRRGPDVRAPGVRTAEEAGASTAGAVRHQRRNLPTRPSASWTRLPNRSRRRSGCTSTTTRERGGEQLSARPMRMRSRSGTVNGYGERCGNADLVAIAANLALKLGLDVAAGGRRRAPDRDRPPRRRDRQPPAGPAPAVRRPERLRAQGRPARERAGPALGRLRARPAGLGRERQPRPGLRPRRSGESAPEGGGAPCTPGGLRRLRGAHRRQGARGGRLRVRGRRRVAGAAAPTFRRLASTTSSRSNRSASRWRNAGARSSPPRPRSRSGPTVTDTSRRRRAPARSGPSTTRCGPHSPTPTRSSTTCT